MRAFSTAIFAGLSLLAPAFAQTYVINNATILTVTKGTFVGSIVVKDGKIAEVGPKVTSPAGAMGVSIPAVRKASTESIW